LVKAIEVTELYLRNLGRLDRADIDQLTGSGHHPLQELLNFVQPTRTPAESMALNRLTSGAVIIASRN
jgi:metallo-beta-lactamase family protein